jgi:hypothetical protein|tara:strand:- start:5077 stop:6075 length:999 start_codon:yes stop_codon:yes gene_type:complete
MNTKAGIFEYIFGATLDERDALLRFWATLGFTPILEGSFTATESQKFYGHPSALTSVRLEHTGASSYGTGNVRIQFWDRLLNDGLGTAVPLVSGSRWMGLYTRDILQLRDSLLSEMRKASESTWVSPLVTAPLANPAPAVSMEEPFVGLRETLFFNRNVRLAFIQRSGFERDGFGTFDQSSPFKNTEGSHANIVQSTNKFDTDLYKKLFGFETVPYGEAHDSGDDSATQTALQLKEGDLFRVERLRAVNCPAGILQVYSPYFETEDLRSHSCAGSRNLSLYSVRVSSIVEFSHKLRSLFGYQNLSPMADELGSDALCFIAPDGYQWLVLDAI